MPLPPEPEPPAPADESLVLVPQRRAAQVGGREMPLTPTQFRLLALLVAQPGRVFSRAELVEGGIGTVVTERTVDVHVKELRRRLGAYGRWIEAVRGRGYRYRGGGASPVA